MKMVGNRLFHTYRDSTAEMEDKIPFLIVSADEATCTGDTKDNFGMAEMDSSDCGVLCVARDADSLAELTTATLNAVRQAFDDAIWEEHDDWDFEIYAITPSADGIEPDPDKPCLFRWMHFRCEI